MNHDTTHSETGEGNHSLADFTINRLHEALEIANKSADDQMFQKREAEAEVARLREELAEIKETYASIVNQPPVDEREVHCSCVPALREDVARLKEAL